MCPKKKTLGSPGKGKRTFAGPTRQNNPPHPSGKKRAFKLGKESQNLLDEKGPRKGKKRGHVRAGFGARSNSRRESYTFAAEKKKAVLKKKPRRSGHVFQARPEEPRLVTFYSSREKVLLPDCA